MRPRAPFALSLSLTLLSACTIDRPLAPVVPDGSTLARVGAAAPYTYDVTITNLTAGQPLSPAIAVTHAPRVELFRSGRMASAGIQAIAEDGNPAVAHAALTGLSGVYDVVATNAPVHRVGGPGASSLTFQISADGERQLLSLATMLICSNDGFAGVRSVALPTDAAPVTYYANGYDAGTERNTESDADIVPPCFGIGPVNSGTGGTGRVPEVRPIRMHPMFDGRRTLFNMYHGWTGPVAAVTIQRVVTR
jgi:hypothetical protein